MKRFVLAIEIAVFFYVLPATCALAGMITVDFDDDSKWTRAASTAISSYSSSHQYRDQGFTFTGGPALRNTTSLQDGFPSALGVHSWRLLDASGVVWSATYTTVNPAIDRIGLLMFDARRWDGAPSPQFLVDYSSNGGASWRSLQTLNNAAFDNSSAWKTFSFFVDTPVLTNGDFIVRFTSQGTTERIMIDNFSVVASADVTAIPEPTSLLLVGSTVAGGAWLRRRMWFAKRSSCSSSRFSIG